MKLTANIEYSGNCRNAIAFYENIFADNMLNKNISTYKDMPMADILGISGSGFDMVWQSSFSLKCGKTQVNFELADALLVAMQRASAQMNFYSPVMMISCDDKSYAQSLFNALHGSDYPLDETSESMIKDLHGINWIYRPGTSNQIFYCLEFNGFCSDVIKYYEDAFSIKAQDIVRYKDSPHQGAIHKEGGDKIYSATITFGEGSDVFSLRLSDDLASAHSGDNGYNPDALLFYGGHGHGERAVNPLFTLRDADNEYLQETFKRLSVGAKLNKAFEPDGKIMTGGLIDRYGICWGFETYAK